MAVPGGNVKHFVGNLANGFITLNQGHLKSCSQEEIRLLQMEIENFQKDLKCQHIDPEELDLIKHRNYKETRLRTAIMVIRNFAYRRKLKV
jgi:hypothetical protein